MLACNGPTPFEDSGRATQTSGSIGAGNRHPSVETPIPNFSSERTQGAFILILISRVSLAGKEIGPLESEILGVDKKSTESIWGREKQTDCQLQIAKCKLQISARLSGSPWSSVGSIRVLVQFNLEFAICNSWRSRLSGALSHAPFPSFANGFADTAKRLGQMSPANAVRLPIRNL